jgi:hypothetical protein
MHRLFMRDHAPVLSVSKELKTWVAVISLTLLTSAAWADPQSEISVYRKSYGISAVTADAKLTELARQQANAMAERRSMDHNVYASFRSRIAPYGSPSAAENLAMGTKTFGETLAIYCSESARLEPVLVSRPLCVPPLGGATGLPYGNPRLVIMRICCPTSHEWAWLLHHVMEPPIVGK